MPCLCTLQNHVTMTETNVYALVFMGLPMNITIIINIVNSIVKDVIASIHIFYESRINYI